MPKFALIDVEKTYDANLDEEVKREDYEKKLSHGTIHMTIIKTKSSSSISQIFVPKEKDEYDDDY